MKTGFWGIGPVAYAARYIERIASADSIGKAKADLMKIGFAKPLNCPVSANACILAIKSNSSVKNLKKIASMSGC